MLLHSSVFLWFVYNVFTHLFRSITYFYHWNYLSLLCFLYFPYFFTIYSSLVAPWSFYCFYVCDCACKTLYLHLYYNITWKVIQIKLLFDLIRLDIFCTIQQPAGKVLWPQSWDFRMPLYLACKGIQIKMLQRWNKSTSICAIYCTPFSVMEQL